MADHREVLDVDLRNFDSAYAAWVGQADAFAHEVRSWYVRAHGQEPSLADMHHAFWRVMVERERWGTLRAALQDTWPQDAPPVPIPLTPIDSPAPSAPIDHGGIRVIRVTDERDGEILNRTYSYWPNAVIQNGTALVFVGHRDERPRFFRVDLKSGSVERRGSRLSYRGTGEGWYFDAEGWVYLLDGPRLRRVHPVSGEDRIVFDIDSSHPGCRLWQAHSSDDGQTHSATVERIVSDGPYQRIGTVVFRQGRQDFYPAQGPLDESQITSDGMFLLIKEGDDNRIINLETRETRLLRQAEGAVGHSDCGPSYVVGEDDAHGACVLWDLRKPLTEGNRRELFRTWGMGHVSVRGGRCLLSNATYVSLVGLDGSGVTPLIEHRMVGSGYDFQVHANLDPSGRVAAYVSNAAGRFDLYLLVLP